jgi:hypothetical protein
MTNRKKPFIVALFFFILILIGIFLVSDFGLSWDEPSGRERGLISLKYILHELQLDIFTFDPTLTQIGITLGNFADKDYGVAFDLPVTILERTLSLNTEASQFRLRHICTFLMFTVGVFAVYRLASTRFNSRYLGLLAALFLILSPRIFGESFYNSKDIVFMALFAVGLHTTITFLRSPSIKLGLLHALVTALTTDIRVMGIVLFFITIGMLFIKLVKEELKLINSLVTLTIYVSITILLIILFWPWLWVNAFSHIVEAIQSMARYRWYENNLYMGEYVSATNVPWHYSLVWIGVTTPLMYLCFGAIGCFTVIAKVIKNKSLWTSDAEMQDLIFLGVFTGAICSVIALRSVLYDGWRQLYFIYPAFIILSIRGLVIIWETFSWNALTKYLIATIVTIGLSQQVFWMYVNHPFQHLYFNVLADRPNAHLFDLDYWGLSNQAALRYIASTDQRERIRVMPVSDNPLFTGIVFMDEKDRKRITDAYVEEQADYLVNNYRFLKGNPYKPDYSNFEIVYELKVGNQKVISVLKRISPPITTGK